ncbi:MAG: sugar ABC transporter ATP-binding protein [Actinobacteria bacterium]|nr:sugar ABC transporter ATP-binding protein [Actinomycetota bacterium]
MEEYILEAKNIVEEFPGVIALDKVNFNLKKGEIHALVGENGAGKSTLIKIICGIYPNYAGEIYVNGVEKRIKSVSYARNLGIAYVPQEIDLMNHLNIEENIFIGKYPGRLGFINWKELKNNTNKVKEQYGGIALSLENNNLVGDLSIAEKQLIEILRVLALDMQIICLDEPTSSLTSEETDNLFELLSKLKRNGIGTIYVSHKLNEIFKISDRITVFKDGKFVKTLAINETHPDEITKLMVGRDLSSLRWEKRSNKIKEEFALEVRGLKINEKIKEINFNLKKGEIHGLFGLVGSGRTEFARVLFGIDKAKDGKIIIFGKEVKIKSSNAAITYGLGLIPEDRHNQGLVLAMDIKNNINFVIYKMISRFGFIGRVLESKKAEKFLKILNIKAPSIRTIVNNLSGGNQQKIVIAKWLNADSKILIFDEPTKGIDVGSKDEIYKLIRSLADEGKSIIFISSELPEIMNLSDRISIFKDGTIIASLENSKNITEYDILKHAIK